MSELRMLTAQSLPGYLASRALLTGSSWTSHRCSITELQSRNRNWMVQVEGNDGYFCKQATSGREAQTLVTEALAYKILNDRVPDIAPRFWDFDPSRSVLTVDAVKGARSLSLHFLQTGRLSLRLTSYVRRCLTQLHAITLETVDPLLARRLGSEPPWVLGVHRVSAADYSNFSACTLQVLAMIQRQPAVCEALDMLHGRWRASELIHGDLKWENLVVSRRDRTGGKRIFMVDWEFARFGLRTWDLGSLISEYYLWWAGSISDVQDDPGGYLNLTASFPLEVMTASARQLLELDRCRDTGRVDLEEVFSLAGARLIQRIVEQAQHRARVTKHMLASLQLACNLLAHPYGAADLLLSTAHEMSVKSVDGWR